MTRTRDVSRRMAFTVCVSAVITVAPVAAQQPSDTAKKPVATQPTVPAGPQISGVLIADYRYGGLKGNRVQNRFEIDRIYVNVIAPAGERAFVRITTDIFQQTSSPADAFYAGWTVRAKYAYLQYEFLRGAPGKLAASARAGLLQTPVIDAEEQFWFRPLGPVAVEQAGFFSSADAGVATTVTLPRKAGEVYLVVANGNGYVSRETDRFKDVGARLTLTPFSNGTTVLKGLAISPWYYKGARASNFAVRKGTVLPVTDARKKDRYGVLVGLKGTRVTFAASLARRADEVETADTTVATAPVVSDRDNTLVSAHTIIRPFAFASATPRWPVLLVFRGERRPDPNADSYSRFYVAGVGYEISRKATLYFDWQSLQPQGNSRGPDTRTFFMHMAATY